MATSVANPELSEVENRRGQHSVGPAGPERLDHVIEIAGAAEAITGTDTARRWLPAAPDRIRLVVPSRSMRGDAEFAGAELSGLLPPSNGVETRLACGRRACRRPSRCHRHRGEHRWRRRCTGVRNISAPSAISSGRAIAAVFTDTLSAPARRICYMSAVGADAAADGERDENLIGGALRQHRSWCLRLSELAVISRKTSSSAPSSL